eukprot:COSAG01_NODE_10922_length_2050_cov_1.242952_1_plen_314_part_00
MPEGLSTHLRATAGRALPPYQDGSAHYCFAQQPSSVVIGCRGTSPQVGMPAADKDSLSFANPLTRTSSGTFDREQQGRYLVPNSTGAVTDALLGLGTAAYRLNLLPGTGQAPMQQPLQPPQPQLNPANMVVNPSFEQAYNIGSPDGMRYDYECVGGAQTEGLQHCVDGSATAFADSRVAVHGTHSLRLTTPSSRGGVRMGPYALEAFEYSKQYTLSFWTRAEPVRPLPPSPQGLVLRLYLSNSWQTPHQLNVSVRGDGEWRQHSIDISAVSAAPKHKPLGGRNWMQYSLVSVGKVWVDLLQLVPTRAAPYHKL